MDANFWARLHGATTHFPIALTLVSVLFEIAAAVLRGRPVRDELLASARFTWWIAALATVPAVASGLVMTRGRLLGHDLLRMHHLFVWPAFALVIASATWRLLAGRDASPRALGGYRAMIVVATGLTAAAGAFGGEMALSSGFAAAAAIQRSGERASDQQPTPELRFERPPPTSPELVVRGRRLFLDSCSHCHGADAHGDEGPDLHGLQVSDRYIAATVTNGIKGEMPSFAKKHGAADIAALTAYVRSLD